ncbi:MAG: RING finger protein [Sulfobacillus sp.]
MGGKSSKASVDEKIYDAVLSSCGKGSGDGEENPCSICLEEVVEDRIRLRCGHEFHYACIRQMKDKMRLMCPNCRHPLMAPGDYVFFVKSLVAKYPLNSISRELFLPLKERQECLEDVFAHARTTPADLPTICFLADEVVVRSTPRILVSLACAGAPMEVLLRALGKLDRSLVNAKVTWTDKGEVRKGNLLSVVVFDPRYPVRDVVSYHRALEEMGFDVDTRDYVEVDAHGGRYYGYLMEALVARYFLERFKSRVVELLRHFKGKTELRDYAIERVSRMEAGLRKEIADADIEYMFRKRLRS